MTPEAELKKFLVLILVLVSIYMGAKTEIGKNLIDNVKSQIFSNVFEDKEVSSEADNETEKENWFSEFFVKNNPTKYWISGNIKINGLSNYNNVTKEQVYNFRKYYVNKTIFNDKEYVPSEEVFGGINEKNKWLGIRAFSCVGPNTLAYQSMSKESKFINNPSILVGIDYVYFPKEYMNCSEPDYIMPKQLSFSKDEKTFYVTYNIPENQRERLFKLVGLNARDLGFKYGFCRKVNNITFVNRADNISKDVYEFKDAIRPDASCGVKGGCNNNVSYQEELFFNLYSSPATFELKLWKEKHENVFAKHDMNLTIILE